MPGGSTVYRFGPFELDASRARLFRHAAPLWLPDSHLAILVQLVSQAGEVISKETLADAGWRGAAVADNSVDKAISRIRKILAGGSDGTRYIETVPNRGYRFAAKVEVTPGHDIDAWADLQLATFRALVRGEHD